MAPRFARPDTDTLPISGGDTLTVKRRLSAGERRQQRGMAEFRVGLQDVSIIQAYLLDWTIKDDGGERVSIAGKSTKDVIDILDNLDPDTFDEILAAINAHVAAMQAERDAEKNAQTGQIAPPISPSLVAAAGASTGSETLTPTTTTA